MGKRQRKNDLPPQGRSWFAERNSLVFGVGATLAAVLLSGYFLDNDTRDRGRILRFAGSVSIERSQERISPVVGAVVNPQDRIITGPGSFIEIAYDDRHKDVLRIGSDSRVVMESACIEKQTNIFMDKGEILLKLESLEKGSTFKIRTPIAIAGVRGTSFGVKLREKDKEALITDFESKIFVKGLTRDFLEMKDELLLSEGWKVRVARFEKPSRVERITPREFAAWQAWLNEIASLPAEASLNRSGLTALSFCRQALFEQRSAFRADLLKNMTLSVPVLAFLLYMALAINLGSAFLWNVNLNKVNI
jgi:hypothetical protein